PTEGNPRAILRFPRVRVETLILAGVLLRAEFFHDARAAARRAAGQRALALRRGLLGRGVNLIDDGGQLIEIRGLVARVQIQQALPTPFRIRVHADLREAPG